MKTVTRKKQRVTLLEVREQQWLDRAAGVLRHLAIEVSDPDDVEHYNDTAKLLTDIKEKFTEKAEPEPAPSEPAAGPAEKKGK